MLNIPLLCFALANPISASADCSSFPIDVFINGIDPRFNLSYADAAQSLQNSIDYINQNVGRVVFRFAENGVPITFEWNDTSAATQTVRQNDEVLKKMQLQINELKSRMSIMTAKHEPVEAINQLVVQINQQVSSYNTAVATQNNIRSQLNSETLGMFTEYPPMH